MSVSIGLIELTSIPVGYETVDAMLKAANVELLRAAPSCPGKYLVVIAGNVGSVATACAAAERTASKKAILCRAINHLADSVADALKQASRDVKVKSLGCVETRTGLGAILIADHLVKAGRIDLMSIRIAQGIGGKGYVNFTGEIAAVNTAIAACIAKCDDPKLIMSTCAIATPHPDLVAHIR
ncbi:BMC domain-containing protein [Paratractidigestivibacter sp.]|uniref:BMC domain-containing protein n=1 Tax=Paratractidigestivibacter sp. TaxID=2847316 RepID=UPI002ABE796C|nr:BMC domain-containing protein [Paratractidigestivibacter sp.]